MNEYANVIDELAKSTLSFSKEDVFAIHAALSSIHLTYDCKAMLLNPCSMHVSTSLFSALESGNGAAHNRASKRACTCKHT